MFNFAKLFKGLPHSVLLLMLLAGSGASARTLLKAPDLSDPVMQFQIIRNSIACEPVCTEWISAEGRIDAESPKKLKSILKELKGRKLPVVLASGGGDVRAAMAMGRMIRKAQLPVYIGGTRIAGCPENEPLCSQNRFIKGISLGTIYSAGAVCFSACPLVLAGGVERKSSPWSLVGVHQITVGVARVKVMYKMQYVIENGRKKILSKREVSRKTLGVDYMIGMNSGMKKTLDTYWSEMGVSKKVTGLMDKATPESIHVILPVDLAELTLTTIPGGADDLLKLNLCKDLPDTPACVKDIIP